jgi:hypothetical protein
MRRIGLVLVAAAGMLPTAGCKSVEEGVGEQQTGLNRYHTELTADPFELPQRQIDWDTAVSMFTNNLAMRTAEEDIIKAETAVRRVFLDLIPQLTLQGIYNQAVTQFTELSSENFDVNVNALFSVPGFLHMRIDYYGAMLACYKARKQYDLAYRNEIANLYTLFRSFEEQEELEHKWHQRDVELWIGLSAALGCYTNCWVVLQDALPSFDYTETPLPMDNPDAVGKLFTTIEAIELEGARLRELGVKFQYWPQLTMRVYSPSVYLLSGGDRGGFEFDADDIRFEAAVRMRLDTNLRIRDELREARRSTALLKDQLYQDGQERARKLIDAQSSLCMMEKQRRILEARLQFLDTAPAAEHYDVFEQSLTERTELLKELLVLQQEQDTLVAVLWVADESRWTRNVDPE